MYKEAASPSPFQTKNIRAIPFEKPPAGEYDIMVTPSLERLSFIAVTRSLGATGIQALDAYYKYWGARTGVRDVFLTNIYGKPGSFVEAAISYNTDANETVFGFWPDELKGGVHSGLHIVTAYISDFLEKECDSQVSLHIAP